MAKYENKAKARLEKRIKSYEENGGKHRVSGHATRKPGSMKKVH